MRSSISLSLSEKMPRSSVASIDSTDVPRTRTPYFSRMPRFSRATPQLRPVWPPIERMIALGPLALDDLLDVLGRHRQQVDLVRLHLALPVDVGLHRRDVRVDQHDLEALLLERLDGLRARVVELARLADGEAARAEEEHLGERLRLGGVYLPSASSSRSRSARPSRPRTGRRGRTCPRGRTWPRGGTAPRRTASSWCMMPSLEPSLAVVPKMGVDLVRQTLSCSMVFEHIVGSPGPLEMKRPSYFSLEKS